MTNVALSLQWCVPCELGGGGAYRNGGEDGMDRKKMIRFYNGRLGERGTK